jgi:hypothetical protein
LGFQASFGFFGLVVFDPGFELFETILDVVPVALVDGDGALAELVRGGEWAEFGIEGEVVDGGLGSFAGRGFGEVQAGGLERIEEQAGAAWVEVVGGDALDDLADSGLDGAAVLDEREVEGGAARLALVRVLRGVASGVVVVAELLVAEADGAAAAAVGEDVAALEALGLVAGGDGDLLLHVGFSLPPGFGAKYSIDAD